MTRTRIFIVTAALLALQAPAAVAQVASPFSALRQEEVRQEARQEARQGRRLELGEVVRRVGSGRQGRMLGVQPRGDGAYVVRWEYPGGRVADITIDARSGEVIGER
jgi:hypothetical protein